MFNFNPMSTPGIDLNGITHRVKVKHEQKCLLVQAIKLSDRITTTALE